MPHGFLGDRLIATLEVDEVAEAFVVVALRKLRFLMVLADGGGHRTAVISAWKAKQHVLVRVSATVSPAKPRPLTEDEEQNLRDQAAQAGAQPWEAQVFLSPDLELLRLEWRPVEFGNLPMENHDVSGS
jgi:hypothetical protein